MKKNKLPIIDKKNFPYTLAMVYWEDIVGDLSWADIHDIKKSINLTILRNALIFCKITSQ